MSVTGQDEVHKTVFVVSECRNAGFATMEKAATTIHDPTLIDWFGHQANTVARTPRKLVRLGTARLVGLPDKSRIRTSLVRLAL